ncbi:MAG: MarR family winged helix-turn-helix transcriptional regulator [Gammaproteobacteria bacterium]
MSDPSGLKQSDVFKLVERITALIRSEERRKCAELGLQQVHLQILDYLARCNRFSDTAAALTNYLGLTKGTVSSSLQIMDSKGLIVKTVDSIDKRVVHLSLSSKGRELLSLACPADLFNRASALLSREHDHAVNAAFAQVLAALQRANRSQAFGLCKTCKHFTVKDDAFMCALTMQSLSVSDSEKICQEHSLAE